ncbi:MAG: hypothetical protein JWM14_1505 [Chitinophagaceae bacterium]|nr:hypothetical protein [Chitinophagaceae bacterium]
MSPTLGDFFDPAQKAAFIAKKIKAGAVVKIFSLSAKKEKRVIILGVYNTQIAYIFINTEINQYIYTTPEHKEEHHFLECKGREYLTADCYVACCYVHTSHIDVFKDAMEQTLENDLGAVNRIDFNAIKARMCKSKMLKPYIKNRYKVCA